MRINSAQGTKKRIYVTPHKSQWHVGQVNSFHSEEVRKLLMQTENITVSLNLRPDCMRLAQHRMKKRRSIRAFSPTEKQRGNSPMQRENWGSGNTARGLGSHTPLKRLLLVILVILAVESISKILQLRLERLRLESLGVDVSKPPTRGYTSQCGESAQ